MGKIAGDSKSALFRQRGLGTKEIAILGKLQIEKDREFAENENELKKDPEKYNVLHNTVVGRHFLKEIPVCCKYFSDICKIFQVLILRPNFERKKICTSAT